MNPRHPLTYLLLALLISLGPAAAASPTLPDAAKAEAKRLRDLGVEESERGEYVRALDYFEKAYSHYPSANLRFNIACVLTDLGRDLEATEAFESFLSQSANASQEAIGIARAKVSVLERRLGRISLHAHTPGIEISVDGRTVGSSPLDRVLRVAPGAHQVVGQRAGYLDAVSTVSVLPGQTFEVPVELHKVSDNRQLKKRWWFWVALGGVVAITATSVALGVKYGQAQDPTANLGHGALQSTNMGITAK